MKDEKSEVMPPSANKDALKALEWQLDWNHLSFWQQLFFSVPCVGPQSKAYRAIVRQLELRSPADLERWKRSSETECHLARTVSSIAASALKWPNDYFIPEDPFAIIVWDAHGDLATSEVLAEIESRAGLRRRTATEWEILLAKSLGEVVRILSEESSKV